MTAIVVRSARPSDVDTIRAIVQAAYSKWVPIIGREPRPMVADYDSAIERHQFGLLQVGDEIVGLVETTLKADHIWIENIAVKPGEQGKGYGSILIAHTEKLAVDAGVGEIRLLTNEQFESNIALYSKARFAIDGREPFMGGMTVYMSKKLV